MLPDARGGIRRNGRITWALETLPAVRSRPSPGPPWIGEGHGPV